MKADQLSLPALFPTPRGIIYDAVTTSGSTKVVHAYSASPVDVTFDLYRRDLGSNPYQVTGSQLASQSAEIDFRGSGVNGRIQVSAACQSAGTVDISFQ